jgi:hypothetical protein
LIVNVCTVSLNTLVHQWCFSKACDAQGGTHILYHHLSGIRQHASTGELETLHVVPGSGEQEPDDSGRKIGAVREHQILKVCVTDEGLQGVALVEVGVGEIYAP